PTSSTEYPPPDRATRALTGTTRTLLTLPVVMVTLTGVWSQPPVAAGSVGVTKTATVGPDEPGPLLPEEAEEVSDDELEEAGVATVPTEAMTPGVVRLLGRVMATLSPTATSACWEASNSTSP